MGFNSQHEGPLGRPLEALGLEVPRRVATAEIARWKPLNPRVGERNVKAKPQEERTDGEDKVQNE
eukprot:CAMPEP_0181461066 /NCGR_PEP_ID=MMETSP1110-20121109/33681_1 /TAXON_ID=174948 /ORGANISM="Symbiodinium sp., Strain CCMP421" /LENGTH=64 /DNA_ID=CAMNT_0023585669 /DNA_START=89 /DNA_END=283 /DNA_ORIENTATION=+